LAAEQFKTFSRNNQLIPWLIIGQPYFENLKKGGEIKKENCVNINLDLNKSPVKNH
jgi:hypothetical protein